MTVTILNTKISEFESKIPDTSGLVITTVRNRKISAFKNKIPDHAKYIITQEFNKLTAQKNFAARLKQANLVSKTDLNKKPINFNRKINSNKTKYLEVEK